MRTMQKNDRTVLRTVIECLVMTVVSVGVVMIAVILFAAALTLDGRLAK